MQARRWPFRSFCACVVGLLIARSAIAQDGADYFIDRRGDLRKFDHEYRVWFTDREPHPIRAAAEALIWIGLGTAYYWLDPLANSEDWDDPSVLDKLRGEALTFDNNLVSTNFILHPIAGAAVYGTARVNGLSVPASFAYVAASSLAWEFALEWREQASVNDLIFTSIGGVSLGEFIVPAERLRDQRRQEHHVGQRARRPHDRPTAQDPRVDRRARGRELRFRRTHWASARRTGIAFRRAMVSARSRTTRSPRRPLTRSDSRRRS